MGNGTELTEIVTAVRADLPHALVALDFDGTLAPLVPDPAASRPLPGTVTALRTLARRGTLVAVITGRDARTAIELGGFDAVPGLVVEGLYGAETWHDVLNALVWLRFPRFKSALNAAHGTAISGETSSTRGRRRDALTVLDESGVWVISRDPALPALLAERAWHSLFWEARSRVETEMRFVVVGHALLEKALAPYPAMTGKCLTLIAESPDPDAADELSTLALAAIDSPRQLAPLPVQGIPGWDPANANAAYYANQEIFRPVRHAAS